MATRIVLIFSFLISGFFSIAQVTTDTKDIQVARQKLQIGTDTSKYFKTILQAITLACTHRQCPTSKAVYDWVTTLNHSGDVSGPYNNLQLGFGVVGINELADGSVTGLKMNQNFASTGYVWKWNGTSWQPAPDAGITGNQTITLGGDASGSGATAITVTNTGLQGRSVSSTAPTTNQVLKWNGSAWAPAADAGGAVNVTARLSGDGTSGSPLDIAQQSATTGQVLKWNGTSWVPAADVGGGIGPGTINYLAKFSSSTTIGNSTISDDGTDVYLDWGSKIRFYYNASYNCGMKRGSRDLVLFANSPDGDGNINLQPGGSTAMTLLATGGYVGINNASPTEKLDVIGNIKGSANLILGSGFKIYNGAGILWHHKTGVGGNFFGDGSGNLTLTGIGNNAIGRNSLSSLTSGSANLAFGDQALKVLTTGDNNCGFGTDAGLALTTGGYNMMMGRNSGKSITTGNENVAIGYNALGSVVTGNDNTAIGFNTLSSITSSEATAIGTNALTLGSNKSQAVAIGNYAGYNTTATNQICIGYYSGLNGAGDNSVYIGQGAGFSNSGNNQLAIDWNSSLVSNHTPLISGSFSGAQVGINTPHSSLTANFHVTGTSSSTGSTALFKNSSSSSIFDIQNAGKIICGTLDAFRTPVLSSDPSSLSNGDLWYNSTSNALKARINSSTVTLAAQNAYVQGGNSFGADGDLGTNDNFDLRFRTNNTYRAKIDQAGSLLVGGTSTTDADASSIVQFTSTTKGFLPPVMTNTQIAAISSPTEGLEMYSSTDHAPKWKTDNTAEFVTTASKEKDITGTNALVTATTYTVGGQVYVVRFDANGNNITATLGSGMLEGWDYVIRCTRNGTNTITLNAESTYTFGIDGDSSLTPTTLTAGAYKIYYCRRHGSVIYIK